MEVAVFCFSLFVSRPWYNNHNNKNKRESETYTYTAVPGIKNKTEKTICALFWNGEKAEMTWN
jgi:hypothetical protein